MSREIKFRTWDTEYKEFSEWTNRDPFFSTSNGKIFFWERTRKEDGSYGGDIVMEDTGDRFVLQQYTGLKDSKGKEIYEGDILKCKGFDGWNDTQGFYYNLVVKHETRDSGESELSGFLFIPKDREVIGNIMQNPELLKQ